MHCLTWYWSLSLAVIVHGKGRPRCKRAHEAHGILIAEEAMNSISASDGETGGHYGLVNRYLIGHYVKLHGK